VASETSGANIWVAVKSGPSFGGSVTKLRASDDGTVLGIFGVGPEPRGIAFDGANVWVAMKSEGIGTVIKLRASDGKKLGDFAMGANPTAVAFDGTNIWVADSDGGTVTKLRPSDGTVLGTFSVGSRFIGSVPPGYPALYSWLPQLQFGSVAS
jgi:DNA-binding beta-propeller fold protein YncE